MKMGRREIRYIFCQNDKCTYLDAICYLRSIEFKFYFAVEGGRCRPKTGHRTLDVSNELSRSVIYQPLDLVVAQFEPQFSIYFCKLCDHIKIHRERRSDIVITLIV